MASRQAEALTSQLRSFQRRVMGTEKMPTLAEQRAAVESMADFATVPEGVRVREVNANGVSCLVHEPDYGDGRDYYVHFHGGGLAMGSPAAWSRWLGHLAARSGRTVLNVGYRLAPEHPFPSGMDDARASVNWLLEQGHEPADVAIGGDSAGCTLALGIAQRLRDEGIVAAGVALLSPWVDFTLRNGSIAAKKATDVLSTPEALEVLAGYYVGDRDRHDPQVSPALASMAGLPAMHIQVSADEILLDDSLKLARAARAAGVAVEVEVWEGVPHVHQMFYGNLPEAAASVDLIATFLRSQSPSDAVASERSKIRSTR